MTEVKFYDSVDDELLKFAVIISKSNGKWRKRHCLPFTTHNKQII